MITLAQYVGVHKDSPDWTPARQANAVKLLAAVDVLRTVMESKGVVFRINVNKTNTCISGEVYGGFRPQSCPIGAPDSAHKEGMAVDIFDPDGTIDAWLVLNQDQLVAAGIYIEQPSTTITWSHWSIRAPGSGHHIFWP